MQAENFPDGQKKLPFFLTVSVHHTMILIGSRQTDAVYPTEGISLLAAVNGGLIRLSFAFRGVEMNVADTQNLIGPPELHREQI